MTKTELQTHRVLVSSGVIFVTVERTDGKVRVTRALSPVEFETEGAEVWDGYKYIPISEADDNRIAFSIANGGIRNIRHKAKD